LLSDYFVHCAKAGEMGEHCEPHLVERANVLAGLPQGLCTALPSAWNAGSTAALVQPSCGAGDQTCRTIGKRSTTELR
jgi:hypothetical protein